MAKTSVIFFGSFQHYSTVVLEALYNAPNIQILGVITTPPKPDPTHTQLWAQAHNIPTLTPTQLTPANLPPQRPDFFVVAGYRNLLPKSWLDFPNLAPLNLHPSLLPQYPGPAPVEWALLKGEKTIGITIIKMTEEYDQGPIIAQQKLPILPTDTRLTLYQKLYELGAQMIIKNLKLKIKNSLPPQPKLQNITYARRLHRSDGFIPWPEAHAFLTSGKDALATGRKIRALAGWPGTWAQVRTPKGTKNLKLLSLTQVQLEGKTPSTFNQIKNQILDKPTH